MRIIYSYPAHLILRNHMKYKLRILHVRILVNYIFHYLLTFFRLNIHIRPTIFLISPQEKKYFSQKSEK